MDDLISEFLAETAEGLSVLDLELVRLEKDPNDKEILGNIFRVMHTIKGTCGFLGLPRLEKVAHAGENILGKIRDGELEATSDTISMVLESIDCIKTIVAHLEAEGAEPEGNDADLIARLNQCADGGGAAPAAATEATVENVEATIPDAPKETGPEDFVFEVTVAEGYGENAPSNEEVIPANDTALEPNAPEVEEPKAQTPPPPPPPPAAEKPEPKKPAAKPKESDNKGGASNQTIRVNVDVLGQLMQTVSELVLTRNQLLQIQRTTANSAFASPLQRLNHITSELQERVMQTRMQPISNAWTPFPRLVRDLSKELGKDIELHQVGAETELDRQLLESIKDPLTHMVRNSCDHGIETIEGRIAAGKPRTGNLTLSAYHEGGHIIIEIADDGKGIPVERIKAKAIANGLATEEELASMSHQQILQFIFRAGFSTAEKVTSVSGRGVGMDVVKTNIEKISGSIELESEEGKGSIFKIKIPLTLAIMPVLIVEAQKQRFAIPQANVLEMVRTGQNSEYAIEYINEQPLLRLRGQLLPLISLRKVLALDDGDKPRRRDFIVICEVGRFHYGIIVDKVFDSEEIVVKPVSPVLQRISLYSGSTILGDGSVIMIIDPNGLAKTTGELPVKTNTPVSSAHLNADGGVERTRFLVFSVGDSSPKVVPLELVTRLEEIDASTIEYTSDGPVIQYRGSLMFITQLSDKNSLPTEGIIQMIVFIDHDKTMGLVVKEILDIVEHTIETTSQSSTDGYLGNIVIEGKTSDLVDVGYYFKKTFPGIKEKANVNESARAHVLYVDDSPFFRKFIPPALITAGYKVTTAENPKEALDILHKDGKQFSVIITDMNMPVMNGAEFAMCCKHSDKLAHIPVIALTSQSFEQMASYADNGALSGYVSKTNHKELLSTISKLLSHRMEGVA